MAKPVPNNPIAPVAEAATDPGVGEVDCEALKVKHGLNDKVKAHEDQPSPRPDGFQSHHILQNACVGDYISHGEGLAVLLANSNGGTAHQVTTGRQNERRDNKRAGNTGATMPATNVGELKKLSQGDLTASFKAMGIEDEEAAALAKCLVDEAEKEMKKAAKRDTDTDVDDDSPVDQTGECFPANTIVWLGSNQRLQIRQIRISEAIQGMTGTRHIVRRDWCTSELIRIYLQGGFVALAPFHRVMMATGEYRRADRLRVGMLVRTHFGTGTLMRVERDPRPQRIYNVGVGQHFECRIGRPGVWVELANTGVPVRQTVRLKTYKTRGRAPMSRRAATALETKP